MWFMRGKVRARQSSPQLRGWNRRTLWRGEGTWPTLSGTRRTTPLVHASQGETEDNIGGLKTINLEVFTMVFRTHPQGGDS